MIFYFTKVNHQIIPKYNHNLDFLRLNLLIFKLAYSNSFLMITYYKKNDLYLLFLLNI